jgi:hypothetical protein
MAESNGLLDLMKSPAAMGLLAAGFGGLAGANRNTPINNIGRAGLAGLAGYSAADALQRDQKKLDQAEAIKAAIPTLYGVGADGKPTFDFQKGAALGIDPADLKAYGELPNVGRSKVTRTIKVPGANGGMTEVLVDEYGNRAGEMEGYVAPQMVNRGNVMGWEIPQAGKTYEVGMTPAQLDAQNRGWANVGLRQDANDLTKDRIDFDKGQQSGDGYSTKPLPAGALKIQDEALSAYGAAGNIQTSLDSKLKQIEEGKLKFGPLSNVANKGLNAAGMSSEESRNFASFMSDLERLRNESLRLNTGVQTDGDAQRAWNELFQNINDTDLVKQRISEIKGINARGAELQRLRIDGVRSNYNAAPYDFTPYDKTAPVVPAQQEGQLTNEQNPPANPSRTVSRTGMMNGRKVIQYSDGSVEYGD